MTPYGSIEKMHKIGGKIW